MPLSSGEETFPQPQNGGGYNSARVKPGSEEKVTVTQEEEAPAPYPLGHPYHVSTNRQGRNVDTLWHEWALRDPSPESMARRLLDYIATEWPMAVTERDFDLLRWALTAEGPDGLRRFSPEFVWRHVLGAKTHVAEIRGASAGAFLIGGLEHAETAQRARDHAGGRRPPPIDPIAQSLTPEGRLRGVRYFPPIWDDDPPPRRSQGVTHD